MISALWWPPRVFKLTVYKLVIAIPVILLRRVQIKLRQKFALGFSLCLSIIMIITAIVKISGLFASTSSYRIADMTWEIFWQFMEACIAVIMVSLTAFRSLFVVHGSGARRSPQKLSLRKRVLNSRIARGRKRAAGNDSEETEGFPEIPRATLTGMRTFIRGERVEGSVMMSERSSYTEDQTITGEHNILERSENVSFSLKPPIVTPRLIWQLIVTSKLHLTPEYPRILNSSKPPFPIHLGFILLPLCLAEIFDLVYAKRWVLTSYKLDQNLFSVKHPQLSLALPSTHGVRSNQNTKIAVWMYYLPT